MTVSCCVLGHLAHNVSESDVCSFFDAWCLCFACCFDSHSRFSKDLLYCCHVQCSQIYARGLNFSSQKVSALLFMAGAAPARSFFFFPSREMSPTGNILKVLWSLAVLLSHMYLLGADDLCPSNLANKSLSTDFSGRRQKLQGVEAELSVYGGAVQQVRWSHPD